MLDLLHDFGQGAEPDVRAIGFATPAIGNQALADFVVRHGWQNYLTSYLLPGMHLYLYLDHIFVKPSLLIIRFSLLF